MSRRILVAHSLADFRAAVAAELRDAGYDATAVGTPEELAERIASEPPDLLVWSVGMEMETFKLLDPWNPRSAVGAVPRISVAERPPVAPGSSWVCVPDVGGRTTLAWCRAEVPAVLDAVRVMLPPGAPGEEQP